jgi:hypothetical protein
LENLHDSNQGPLIGRQSLITSPGLFNSFELYFFHKFIYFYIEEEKSGKCPGLMQAAASFNLSWQQIFRHAVQVAARFMGGPSLLGCLPFTGVVTNCMGLQVLVHQDF